MKNVQPFRLHRRTLLKGLGVAACLPYMECMADNKKQLGQRTTPAKRLAYVYTPNGVAVPGEDSPYKEWNWFPSGEGKNYTLTHTLQPLTPHRQDISILGGLSHPKSRSLLGHIAGDTFLTGGDVRNEYNNSISVDQYAAQIKKQHTRYPSLVLSADGGIGFKSRVSTLSFDPSGQAIPSEHNHRNIFERYFSLDGKSASAERRKSLVRQKKMVDLILADSKRLQTRLGVNDRHKLDEHLSSLSSLEEQIQRNEAWLDVPLKSVNTDHLDLIVDAKVDPQAYIRSMYDLIVLGFQLDLTEVTSYMVSREDGMGVGDAYPILGLGLKKGHHAISHDKSEGHWREWGQYDQWMVSHFAYFIDRMKNTQDEFGSLLDSTQILYGSACSSTHNARNYPIVLAGGKNMGLKHGSYTKFTNETPMSNLFVNQLQAAGILTNTFSDSTDKMAGMEQIFSHTQV